MDHEPANKMTPGKNQYWRYTRRLTTTLLFVWAGLCFCVLFFARELYGVNFFGWSFSFYMAAQGLTLSFVLILAIYSIGMHLISRQQRGH